MSDERPDEVVIDGVRCSSRMSGTVADPELCRSEDVGPHTENHEHQHEEHTAADEAETNRRPLIVGQAAIHTRMSRPALTNTAGDSPRCCPCSARGV